jgi:tetratricopeptide (TPR) repeat protein
MRAGLWAVVGGGIWLGVGFPVRAQQAPTPSPAPSASASASAAASSAGAESGPRAEHPQGGADLQANARDHFERALERYRHGDYAGAAQQLNAALELDPNSRDLVYNLGLVYEKLGDLDGAITQFERLLEIEKHPGERELVRRAIRRLEGARRHAEARAAAQREAEKPPPQAPPPRPLRPEQPPARQTSSQPLDGWVVGAGSLALAAVSAGVALGVAALGTHPGSEPRTGSERSIQEIEDRAELAHTLAVAADVALAVGVVSGGVAFGLYVSREKPAEPGPEGLPQAGIDLGLGVRGAF